MIRGILLTSFVFLLLLTSVSALEVADYDIIVVNSVDWKDAYLITLYSELLDKPAYFITSEEQALTLSKGLPGSISNILLLESSEQRVSSTITRLLQNKGFTVDVERGTEFSELFLLSLDSSSLIIINEERSSDSIAVAPYASYTNSVVFIASKENIDALESLLDAFSFESILLYGQHDEEIVGALLSYDYATLDTGNKFTDNTALIDKYLSFNPVDQLLLSDGKYFEASFFDGSFPVLVIGSTAVPPQIEDYMASSSFNAAVAVGPETVPVARKLKRQLETVHNKEISLMGKLAMTSRDPTAFNEVEPLDIFRLPVPTFSMNIPSVLYNQLSGVLEILIQNDGDVRTFYTPTIVFTINGETVTLDQIEEYYFLDGSRFETLLFPLALLPGDVITGSVVVVYGDSPSTFEYSTTYDVDAIEFISIDDQSNVTATSLYYSKRNDAFLLEVTNIGDVTAYVDARLHDVLIVLAGTDSFSIQ